MNQLSHMKTPDDAQKAVEALGVMPIIISNTVFGAIDVSSDGNAALQPMLVVMCWLILSVVILFVAEHCTMQTLKKHLGSIIDKCAIWLHDSKYLITADGFRYVAFAASILKSDPIRAKGYVIKALFLHSTFSNHWSTMASTRPSSTSVSHATVESSASIGSRIRIRDMAQLIDS